MLDLIWKTNHFRLFLIGFMGSGKSYLSQRLATRLAVPFLDLDELIERRLGTTIRQYFDDFGEAAFREVEQEELRKLDQLSHFVLACGGGTPCFHSNLDWMQEVGTTCFLDVTPDLLADRLRTGKAQRPLISAYSEAELLAVIKEKLAERRTCYERAHWGIPIHSKSDDPIEPIVQLLIKQLQP